MTWLEAILLAALEGLTEFLPISSTGHLILAREALDIPDSSFATSFIIAIQLGAIAAVVVLYWRRFLLDPQTLLHVVVALVPTLALGFAFYKIIKTVLLVNPPLVVCSLVIGGIVLILFEWLHGEKPTAEEGIERMPLWKAAAIGACQAVAMVPGVSRSAATIVGGLALGVRRATMVEFSFLLAAPTMAAATGYDLLKSADAFSAAQVEVLLVGIGVAFLVALLAIRLFLHYVKSHTLVVFGVYRIVLGAAFGVWLVLAGRW